MSHAPRLAALALLLGAAACSDVTEPRPVPGEVEVRLESPHGAEGGAVVELPADRVIRVTGLDGGMAYVALDGGTLRVAVVLGAPGTVRFRVTTDDVGADLGGTVLEVAGPDNVLRGSLAGYRVVSAPGAP